MAKLIQVDPSGPRPLWGCFWDDLLVGGRTETSLFLLAEIRLVVKL